LRLRGILRFSVTTLANTIRQAGTYEQGNFRSARISVW
jgi:hypothetical protein